MANPRPEPDIYDSPRMMPPFPWNQTKWLFVCATVLILKCAELHRHCVWQTRGQIPCKSDVVVVSRRNISQDTDVKTQHTSSISFCPPPPNLSCLRYLQYDLSFLPRILYQPRNRAYESGPDQAGEFLFTQRPALKYRSFRCIGFSPSSN